MDMFGVVMVGHPDPRRLTLRTGPRATIHYA